jgi:hypothetical protein
MTRQARKSNAPLGKSGAGRVGRAAGDGATARSSLAIIAQPTAAVNNPGEVLLVLRPGKLPEVRVIAQGEREAVALQPLVKAAHRLLNELAREVIP